MKKDYANIVFILDCSGSMRSLQQDTIGSFNSLLETQKKEEGNALVTTVLFNHEIKKIHNELDINKVQELTNSTYFTSGTTAMYDAIGSTVQDFRFRFKDLYKENRPTQNLFIIITDGMENASREFSGKKVKQLIEQATEEDKFEFLFIGANIDAIKEGSSIGIGVENTANYMHDKKGNQIVYESISKTVTNYRKSSKLDKNWKKDIDRDYSSRK